MEKRPSQVINFCTILRTCYQSSFNQEVGIPHLQSTIEYWGLKNVVMSPILVVFFLYHFPPAIGRLVASKMKAFVTLNLREPTLTYWPLKDLAKAIDTP
jgi:hypothetical protein